MIERDTRKNINGVQTLYFPKQFDSEVFGRVLKIMYINCLKDDNSDITHYRLMYRLACKMKLNFVQRYLIVHKLLCESNVIAFLKSFDAFVQSSKIS